MRNAEYVWDFFLAHAALDAKQGEELYERLSTESKVFFDKGGLDPGVPWDTEIPDALRKSRTIVILVSANTSQAFYQREEIAEAVQLARSGNHTVVPVYLADVPPPYGLRTIESIPAYSPHTISEAARSLVALHRQMKPAAWQNSDHIFDINGWRVWYLPVINSPGTEVAEFSPSQVELRLKSDPTKLPHEFETTAIDTKSKNYPSCRLESYYLTEEGQLVLTLSKTSYHDYLKSGEHLDDLLPNERTKTFRDHFGQLVAGGRGNIRPSQLSNICGVGVFIISSDGNVLVTKHSENSHVYPGRFTYSASGTVRWGAYPHPFSQAMFKCFEEIKHQVNFSNLRLVGFGADARKLFFQFSF